MRQSPRRPPVGPRLLDVFINAKRKLSVVDGGGNVLQNFQSRGVVFMLKLQMAVPDGDFHSFRYFYRLFSYFAHNKRLPNFK